MSPAVHDFVPPTRACPSQRPHAGQPCTLNKEIQELPRGKKCAIVCPETGKVYNQSIVSPQSPEWFKSAFEENRAFFERSGKAQRLKDVEAASKPTPGYSAGLLPKSKLPGAPLSSGRKINLSDTQGRIRNKTIVSTESPEWFKSYFEQCRDFFEKKGMAQKIADVEPSADDADRFAGVSSYFKGGAGKRNQIVMPHTGEVKSKTIVSQSVPDFMKSPFENNKDYFSSKGVTQKLKNMPNKKKIDEEFPLGKKKTQIRDPETGKVYNQTIVSVGTPKWMKSPYDSNHAYFESQGILQKLKDVKQRGPGKRRTMIKDSATGEASYRRTETSTEIPDWMKSVETSSSFMKERGMVGKDSEAGSQASTRGSSLTRKQQRVRDVHLRRATDGKVKKISMLHGISSPFEYVEKDKGQQFETNSGIYTKPLSSTRFETSSTASPRSARR